MAYILGGTKARSWRKLKGIDYFLLVFFVFCVTFIVYRLVALQIFSFDFQRVLPYIVHKDSEGSYIFGSLLDGFCTTLRLGFWSFLFAIVVGAFVGIISAHKRGFASIPAKLYIQFIRNIPPLVLLFLIFFFASYIFTEPILKLEIFLDTCPSFVQDFFYTTIAPKGKLDSMFAAILTLGLYEGAYVAEIIRGGIESIPKAQWEAARSQGFTLWQTRQLVIIPQAFRISIPPLIGQAISTFKDSALASIISLPELTFQSTEVMTVTSITLELWIIVAFLYYIISFTLERTGQTLEKKANWYGR